MGYFTCRSIAKTYGSVVALQAATLEVEKGEVRAVLGGNGSGKSTLAKIIGGAVNPDRAEIMLENQKLSLNSPVQARQQGIVVTSQELSLFPNLTVEENLNLINSPKRFSILSNKQEAAKKAAMVLARVGLAAIQNKMVSELSDDQKYLVEFAKALMQKPKILVIDEITSALYREQVETVKGIIQELSAKGCSILFISHRMSEIYAICSTVTVMRNGSVVSTYKLHEVKEDTLLRDMIGHDVPSLPHDSSAHNYQKEESAKVLFSVKELNIPGFENEVNLELHRGEVIGIAGLQGQGQSQLLKALFGLSGTVELMLDNQIIKLDSPVQAIQAGIAFLTGDRERDGIFRGRSISENLEVVNLNVLRKPRFENKQLLSEYKVKYNSIRQAIDTLSGGNQQKIVLGRWTGVQPKVLLADDPTKGVDVAAREDVHQILNNLVNNGSAVIVVSSDEEELVSLANVIENYRVQVMYNGNFVSVLKGNNISIANIISASMPRSNSHD